MKTYSVYILKCADQSYYTGVTNDVFQRELQHNQGLDKKAYTYQRRPVKLVWHQEFTDPNLAIAKEKQIKGWNRKKKEALILNKPETLRTLSMNSLRQTQTDNEWILKKLPYGKPFLFVDEIIEVNQDSIKGKYTFTEDLPFYQGHFKEYPVTPGVILTECCAQIGLVCLGIFLLKEQRASKHVNIAFSESHMEFLQPVYPDETVTVFSEKIYFRFNKLKCKVKMFNADGILVCKGVLSGIAVQEDGR